MSCMLCMLRDSFNKDGRGGSLWREVAEGADDPRGDVRLVQPAEARQPKVGHLGLQPLVQQNVAGLHVAVDLQHTPAGVRAARAHSLTKHVDDSNLVFAASKSKLLDTMLRWA
jgi:hypothetical protein